VSGCRIGEIDLEGAARLQRAHGVAGKAKLGGKLIRIERFVFRAHRGERAIEQRGGRKVAQPVARALAGKGRRAGNQCRLEDDDFANKACVLGRVGLAFGLYPRRRSDAGDLPDADLGRIDGFRRGIGHDAQQQRSAEHRQAETRKERLPADVLSSL